MRLIGRETLQQVLRANDPASIWVRAWVAELANANWKHPVDVTNQFPNARQDGAGRFIFPINDCNKEVNVQIAFQQGIAVITGLQ